MPGTNPTTKPTQPDCTSDDSSTYKGKIDSCFNASARIAWAFAPHAQDTPDMTVRLEAGQIWPGDVMVEVAAQSTATISAATATERIDRLVIDESTGAVSVVTGVEDATPVAPAVPAGKMPVARVHVTTTTTTITNLEITDERPGPYQPLGTLTLSDITDAGTAAGVDTGITEGDVPVLDASGKLAEGVIPDVGGGWEFIKNITANETFDASGYSALIVVVAGGGGRSEDTGTGQYDGAAGAGAGGGVRGLIASPEAEYVCTIGSGASSSYTSGGTTSLGTAISCTGGNPGYQGPYTDFNNVSPGTPGTVTVDGSIEVLAKLGRRGGLTYKASGSGLGGEGGDSILGRGGIPGSNSTGQAGVYGSGGGGGGGRSKVAGNGGAGIIQVWGKV